MRGVSVPVIAAVTLAGLVGVALLVRQDGPGQAPSDAGPQRTATAKAANPAADARAEAIALQSLRARQRDPDAVMFREVRTWRFGPDDERAVCGVMEARDLPGGSAPFVVRVLLPAGSGGGATPVSGTIARPRSSAAGMPILEDGPGTSRPAPEARRRYCHDAEAAPTAAAAPAAPTVPSAAATAPAMTAPSTSAATTTAMTAGAPAAPAMAVGAPDPLAPPFAATIGSGGVAVRTGEQVTVATHANLRAGPTGGEPVLSVVPRGSVLNVYGRAPGGWVRVGDGEPWGWIHGSMLTAASGAATPTTTAQAPFASR
jgi:hypothetical protein